jgi:S-adenosylmethionine hydrolase
MLSAMREFVRSVAALLVAALVAGLPTVRGAGALVLQTDFGTKDGAVAAMKGVAVSVDPQLPVFDLTHEITAFDIWQAAYRLKQTAPYWPAGTVFVSVVDPGVGTDRKSIVLRTKSGHLFVSPDNGTLTLIAEDLGIAAVRTIDETRHRLPGSEKSYTFHGRDVYAYTGARLAAGAIAFEDVGPELSGEVVRLAYEKARRDGEAIIGNIPALDVQYGNVWTNISGDLLDGLGAKPGDRFTVMITHDGRMIYAGEMPLAHTFGDVPEGAPLLYLNSLLNVSFALNLGNFAAAHKIDAGAAWSVRIERADRTR